MLALHTYLPPGHMEAECLLVEGMVPILQARGLDDAQDLPELSEVLSP